MKVAQLRHAHQPLPEALTRRIASIRQGAEQNACDLARLDHDVALAFVAGGREVIAESGIGLPELTAAGCSGQIVARTAAGQDGYAELHLGSPAIIVHGLTVPVVAGFAAGDLAVGGRGGPVTAWPDWLIFRDRRLSRVIVRLGGAASIALVPAASVPGDVVAFDVGPCGLILDALSRRLFSRPHDADGGIAAKGRMSGPLLNELLAGPYFHSPPPKRIDPADWSDAYIERLTTMAGKHRCSDADLMATVTEMIARTVADATADLTERPHEVVLTGGGGLNIHLAGRIRALMSPSSTYAAERYGFDTRAYSAACYAVLAAARIDSHSAHCRQATGAEQKAVLGAIWRP